MRPSWNNRYYVLEVLEEHAKHSELEALSVYLKTPKYLHTDRGDLNRPLNVRPKTLTLRRSVFLWQNIALHLN